MMEIKCYKSTLIEITFYLFNLGPTCPGPSFYGAKGKGPNCPVPTALIQNTS